MTDGSRQDRTLGRVQFPVAEKLTLVVNVSSTGIDIREGAQDGEKNKARSRRPF
jgi:hypothetical protein